MNLSIEPQFSLSDFNNLLFCVLQVKKLKGQLEEKQKNGKMENTQSEDEVLENGTDMHMIDLQSELHFDFKRTLMSCM